MQTNHIAVLVRNLETVSNSLPDFCIRHSIEVHASEGTREQYVEVNGDSVSLLLVQAIGTEGPYARALSKRGPGLHHIGCITPSIKQQVCRQNLLLHPISLETISKGVVWLCKPALPFLIELMEANVPAAPLDACRLFLPFDRMVPPDLHALSSNLTISNTAERKLGIEVNGRRVDLNPELV